MADGPGKQKLSHSFLFSYLWDCNGVSGGDKQSWILILVQGGIRRLQSGLESLKLIRRGRRQEAGAISRYPADPSFPGGFDIDLGPLFLFLRLPWG